MFGVFKRWTSQKEIKKHSLDVKKVPEHIAIIMDGNGRWAKKRGLPRTAGHQKGVQVLKEICYACGDLGIKYLSVFAFSTENWERPVTEVNFLMNLFKKVFTEEIGELENENVRVQILGSRNNLDKGLLQVIDRLEKRTQNNDGLFLNVCLNYGGRAEIIEAVNKILSEDQIPEKIDEESLKEFLYTKDLPDVELMIRTSGEMRISNFFLYQSAYAELVFTPVLWPNFTKEDLKNALIEFQNRDRRFGRVEKR